MAPIDREKLEWRSPIVSRVLGWLFLSLFTIASLACFVAAAFASSALRLVVGGVVLALMAVALSSLGLLARITATDHGLAVKNWRRTITIEWRDIGRLEASYRGVLVFRRSGRPVASRIAQKSNMATARHRRVHADAIVDEVAKVVAARVAK